MSVTRKSRLSRRASMFVALVCLVVLPVLAAVAGPVVGYGGNSPTTLELYNSGFKVSIDPATLSADRTLTLPNSNLNLANVQTFTSNYQSATTAATGSAQTFAHGLGRAPANYWVETLAGHNGSGSAGTQVCAVTYGTVDATNVTVTVSQACSIRVHAM